MQFSPQQEKALAKIARWQKAQGPLFYLAGYAGTGKTTLAKHIAAATSGTVLFAAFTGKAAHVLQRSGCEGASTIHSLIYRVREKSTVRLQDLQAELGQEEGYDEPNEIKIKNLKARIKAEEERVRSPFFELNPDSPLKKADLLIVDEVSMVTDRMADDLFSFQVPVLVLGDPAQLPPVRGGGAFTEGRVPDFTLTEIHRQARDNPIIRIASEIREKRFPNIGAYGESQIIPKGALRLADYPGFQVIVGRNKTRRRANVKARELRGYGQEAPVSGDRLVCLRNDHEAGLLNGAIWRALTDASDEGSYHGLHLESEDTGEKVWATVHAAPFLGEEVEFWDRKTAQEFDYGYALTAHKAQGSQFADVVVVDEGDCFRQDRWRWRYTAITRAAERVVIAV